MCCLELLQGLSWNYQVVMLIEYDFITGWGLSDTWPKGAMRRQATLPCSALRLSQGGSSCQERAPEPPIDTPPPACLKLVFTHWSPVLSLLLAEHITN